MPDPSIPLDQLPDWMREQIGHDAVRCPSCNNIARKVLNESTGLIEYKCVACPMQFKVLNG